MYHHQKIQIEKRTVKRKSCSDKIESFYLFYFRKPSKEAMEEEEVQKVQPKFKKDRQKSNAVPKGKTRSRKRQQDDDSNGDDDDNDDGAKKKKKKKNNKKR